VARATDPAIPGLTLLRSFLLQGLEHAGEQPDRARAVNHRFARHSGLRSCVRRQARRL